MPPLLNPSVASGAAFELDVLRSQVQQVLDAVAEHDYCVLAPTSAKPLLDWLLETSPAPASYCYVADTPNVAEASATIQAISDLVGRGVGALLVVGDGSPARSAKAPGYLDERAADFDGTVERALRSADPGLLAHLDYSLASELDVAGRSTWPIAATVTQDQAWRCDGYDFADPYGVAYFVALWRTGMAGIPSETPASP